MKTHNLKPKKTTERAFLHPTQNNLPASTRAAVIAVLDARLAETIDLMHQAKQAHWNVKGRNFIALHQLFDQVADAADEFMDLIAERVVQLGGTAEGTIQVAVKSTDLAEYPLEIKDEQDHVVALSAALAAYGERVRKAIDQSEDLGDRDTADLFTEVSRGADKYLWFVESHISPSSERKPFPSDGLLNRRTAGGDHE